MSDINKETLNEKELLEELLEEELLVDDENDDIESNDESSDSCECSPNCGLTKIYSKSVNIWINCCKK